MSEDSQQKKVAFFDSAAPEYDAWYDGEGKLIFETELKALEEVLSTLPHPWLEVGIGSGRFALALGIETGIDPSAGMAEIARVRGLKVIHAQGEKLPFEDGRFGSVFLLFTLCFADSTRDVLKEAHRVLRPGGKVVVGEVMRDSPFGKYYQSKKGEGSWYRFSNFCGYQDLTGLVKEAGFTVERVVSTLRQTPGSVTTVELPQEGYSAEASFTVLVGARTPGDKDR